MAEVAKLKDQSFKQIKKSFLRWFATFGVPDKISTDGGPPYNGFEYREFLKTWKIEERKSSAYYAQSNGRAEAAVKTVKRLLLGNVNPMTGEVDTDAVSRALLAHRNTPCQQNGLSPSELLFGHNMRDHMPNKFRKLRKDWRTARRAKELPCRITRENLQMPKRNLYPLAINDYVAVQNQSGNKPKKWSNTGHVVKVLSDRKYVVMIDGSKRLTTRNRKFLKKIPAKQHKTVRVPETCEPVPSSQRNLSQPMNEADESSDSDEPDHRVKVQRRRNDHDLQQTSTPLKKAQTQQKGKEPFMTEREVLTRFSMPIGPHETSIPLSQPKDPPTEALQQQTPIPIEASDEDHEPRMKKYPRRNNVRRPSRYGFKDNE